MNANELTFGIEIETTMPYNTTPVGYHGQGVQIPWLPAGWLADRDPSITPSVPGHEAVEVVSPVLKGAEGLRQLLEVVAELKRRGAKVNASCGLHIHVGFDRNDKTTLDRLISIVANHEKAIYASTGTKSRERGRWCNGVQRYATTQNVVSAAGTQRYHVLNLTNLTSGRKPTVEFRAFAASLNPTKIVGYIRMCLGLVELAHKQTRAPKFVAKKPVETSPITRGGEGATEINRLFYKLGWTKGRTQYTFGNVDCPGAPDRQAVKDEFIRLARKYDAIQ